MEEKERVKVSDRRLSTKDMAAAAERNPHVQAESGAKLEEEDRVATKPREHIEEELSPLLSPQETGDFRSRWNSIQTGFVDEPRRAVEQADELVAQIMQRLAQSFSDQRSTLETQWEHSDKVSTEELRVAFRRYRSFFDRLLSI